MPTSERIEKVERVLASRQADLRVVLEGVTLAHNASAVMRTCDAAGVLHLDLIGPNPEALKPNKAISTRADKWLEISVHPTPASCLMPLKEAGYQILATHLRKDSVPYTEIDLARPVAIVFGSEAEGITEECLSLADKVVRIPMFGMVQSLNLSVSVAVMLYEALRQRAAAGLPGQGQAPGRRARSAQGQMAESRRTGTGIRKRTGTNTASAVLVPSNRKDRSRSLRSFAVLPGGWTS